MDEKTFDIYKNGLTSTINQVDSDFGTATAMAYCPKSVSEMAALVAILRPGCASLRQDFIDRKPYSTGVEELDDLLAEGNHRMIYQELIMKYLIWLSIPETGSYDIIKKIAKKKFKEKELEELETKLFDGWKQRVGKEEGFIETWTVVEQASKYSFNAAHALCYAYDSVYGAYLKSHYPLEYFTVALRYYEDDFDRTMKLTNELQSFGVSLKPIKFRYSKADYALDRESNSIYKGVKSVKNLNAEVSDKLYDMRGLQYSSFMDLLYDLKPKTNIKKNQIKILIELEYFSEFGDANQLLKQFELFDRYSGRKELSKEELSVDGVPLEVVSKFSWRETKKLFTDMRMKEFLCEYVKTIRYQSRTLSQTVKAQIEYLGYVDIADERYSGMVAVLDFDTKYTPKFKMHSLKNGTVFDCKIDKRTYNKDKLEEGDVIRILAWKRKPKSKKDEETGEWVPVTGTSELWITKYERVK